MRVLLIIKLNKLARLIGIMSGPKFAKKLGVKNSGKISSIFSVSVFV